MISPVQKVSQAYKAKSFNSYDSNHTPILPRGSGGKPSDAFPKEKSFKELLKREMKRS